MPGRTPPAHSAPSCPTLPDADTYTFDRHDPVARSVLLEIGLSAKQVDDGFVTMPEVKAAGIDTHIFGILFGMSPPPTEACPQKNPQQDFSKEEARFARLLINNVRDQKRVQALFRSGVGPDGWTAMTVLGNYSSRPFEPNLIGAIGIHPESQKSLEELRAAGITPNKLAGVHFTDDAVNPDLQMAGKGVVPITWHFPSGDSANAGALEEGIGSAVIVSPEGDVFTARHVLHSLTTGAFNLDTKIELGEMSIPFSQVNIVREWPEIDIVWLKIPELAGREDLPFIQLADELPDEGEVITGIGFPRLDDGPRLAAGNQPLKTYTTGTVLGTAILDRKEANELNNEHTQLVVSARLFVGYSGGALVNAQNELVGINYGIEPGKKSFVTGLFEANTANADFQQALQSIREKQDTAECPVEPAASEQECSPYDSEFAECLP